ncbi:hypothetical protein HNQ59_001364 [Chitinivorax tropicus]|uniref:Uncharacterized protein n=1 Tax=Chitinivorax tropicus TaxID=714531 RepID=A0A840MLS2_9PROT|nr:hypothetical protein [Chitinivorax tropicus]
MRSWLNKTNKFFVDHETHRLSVSPNRRTCANAQSSEATCSLSTRSPYSTVDNAVSSMQLLGGLGGSQDPSAYQ